MDVSIENVNNRKLIKILIKNIKLLLFKKVFDTKSKSKVLHSSKSYSFNLNLAQNNKNQQRSPDDQITELSPLDNLVKSTPSNLYSYSTSLKSSLELTQADMQISLPNTDNKKYRPNKLPLVDSRIYMKAAERCRSDMNTPVTIDILTESGRFTRQSSLEPLATNRESQKSTSVSFRTINH
jgi:hypothetical protein